MEAFFDYFGIISIDKLWIAMRIDRNSTLPKSKQTGNKLE